MTELSPMASPMAERITKNMLRYHVGISITCPACGDILDCRRAVEMNFSQFDKLVHSGIRCARCFDAMGDVGLAAKRRGLTVELADGRVLFAAAPVVTSRAPRGKMDYIIEWNNTEAHAWERWEAESSHPGRMSANDRLRLIRGIYPDTRFRIKREATC
jgi:hypothetical protein